jgi:MinD superfamily P-loop ATPase
MVIAIASGKGGTGKTTVATALALSSDEPVTLLDCDVEGANDAIFFSTEDKTVTDVTVQIPVVDRNRCTGCGECLSVCAYNAIVVVKGKALVFPELCHSCGGCVRVCAANAITENAQRIGSVTNSRSGNITLAGGELSIGNAMSPPVIRQVKAHIGKDGITIIDSPPGTSCPMITAVKHADYVVLVTEPTPFGLHDLKLAVKTVRMLSLPFGVVVNRSDSGDSRVDEYCVSEQIDILMKIPDRIDIARNISGGKTILDSGSEFRPMFKELLHTLKKRTGEVRAGS